MVSQPATARKLKSCAPGLPYARGVPWSETGNYSGECKGECMGAGRMSRRVAASVRSSQVAGRVAALAGRNL
jgi:hypothetical protein